MATEVRNEALKIVRNGLQDLRKRIIANHEAARQVASGRTRDSLKVEMTENGGILWGRQAFGVLETGRKSGRVPKGFYGIILQWVKDKGIHVENPKSFAYLVARKIANEGTKLYRSGQKEDIYSTEVEKTIQDISDRISVIFNTEVEHINLNFSNENSDI